MSHLSRAGAATVVEWSIVTVAALIVAALLVHWVTLRFEREVADRLEADRLERLERYNKAAGFRDELASRRRHPTFPSAVPADQVDRWFADAAAIRDFNRELSEWDGPA